MSPPPSYTDLKSQHKFCLQCGKELVLRSYRDLTRKKYCSHACRQIYRYGVEAWDMGRVSKVGHVYSPPKKSKICLNCGKTYLPASGGQKWCRECVPTHHYSRMRHYGLTYPEYMSMIDSQKGLCAICGKESDRLFVDHSHKTGKVRGLLCQKCNFYLYIMEDPEWMEKAKAYLDQFDGAQEDVTV